MPYPDRLEKILSIFRASDDPALRSDLLIEFADRFTGVPEQVARPPFPIDRRVPGCESEVYIFPEQLTDGTLKFHFAVENPQGISAKGLAVILDESLSGELPEALINLDSECVYDIFGRGLSMGKGRGLTKTSI